MNSFSKMKSQKFQINGPKHSLSRSSNLSFGQDNDDNSTSRPPTKRGRLSSMIHKSNFKYTALFDFKGYANDELNFKKGDEIQVTDQDDKDRTNWWRGRINGKEGMFPTMYVAQKNCGLSPKEIDPREVSLQEFIGKGGFATVRRGFWRNEEVAVKIIRDSSADVNAKKEATFYWLVRHPNIISLLGVCSRPPDFWLVMEYARGGSLNQVLSNNFLSLQVIINWSTQIARAMKYLHQDAPIENIIHRDLKSKNIVIFESLSDGQLENLTLKITDFGLARQALHTTQMTKVAGTFEWMAPEVFKVQQISTASDVWSFGVVLWEMLTSQVPYKNFNQYQIVYGVGNNTLKLPIPRSCPKLFEELLKRCWNINPKERPTFVKILEDLLQSIQKSIQQHDIETFTALQQSWREEVEHEMETIRSESDNTMNNTFGGDNQISYGLESIVEGIRQRFKELEKLEMQLIEKELSLAVRQFNNNRKRRKKLNIFSWKKKYSLKISKPSNFQHNLRTIVEETKIPSRLHSPPIFVKTIRVNTNSSQGDVNMSTENLPPAREISNYTIASGLRQVTKLASCIVTPARSSDSPIIKYQRESLLPPPQHPPPPHHHLPPPHSDQPPKKPTTLDVKPFYIASQQQENVTEIPSSGDQKKSPFKVEIIQDELKSRVIISGNNPEQTNYMEQNVFENHAPLSTSRGSRVSSFRVSTVSGQLSQQAFDGFPSFGDRIKIYGSLSTLKNRTENNGIAGKISYIPSEIFPYGKVGKRQSWLNLKNGKSVAELRAFFSQKLNHDKLTVH